MLVDIHAAITMRFTAKASKAPCNCEAQKHAKHTEPAITLQTTPSPARTRLTHEVPFIAGCSHFTRKNTFRAPASSPKQTPCNIHAAITTRFATKASKAPCNCEAQKHAKHTEPAITLRTTPSPARTRHTHTHARAHTHTSCLSSPAAATLHDKTQGFAPASSPKPAPCDVFLCDVLLLLCDVLFRVMYYYVMYCIV